jgi:hypothetical protein
MVTVTGMTPEEQVTYFSIQDELVENRTMEEATAKDYAATCIERARAYQERIQAMTIPLYLTVWAKEMAARHGKAVVKVHHNYLPWIAAFLVARYGEAVDCWPETLSEKDRERAREWKRGAVSRIVTV